MRTQGKTNVATEGTEMKFEKYGSHFETTKEIDLKQLFAI